MRCGVRRKIKVRRTIRAQTFTFKQKAYIYCNQCRRNNSCWINVVLCAENSKTPRRVFWREKKTNRSQSRSDFTVLNKHIYANPQHSVGRFITQHIDARISVVVVTSSSRRRRPCTCLSRPIFSHNFIVEHILDIQCWLTWWACTRHLALISVAVVDVCMWLLPPCVCGSKKSVAQRPPAMTVCTRAHALRKNVYRARTHRQFLQGFVMYAILILGGPINEKLFENIIWIQKNIKINFYSFTTVLCFIRSKSVFISYSFLYSLISNSWIHLV